MLQLAPAASETPHRVDFMKSPVIPMEVIANGALPLFVKVTCRPGEPEPTRMTPNERLLGASFTLAPLRMLTSKGADSAETSALCVAQRALAVTL
jgi:hypothetical protein